MNCVDWIDCDSNHRRSPEDIGLSSHSANMTLTTLDTVWRRLRLHLYLGLDISFARSESQQIHLCRVCVPMGGRSEMKAWLGIFIWYLISTMKWKILEFCVWETWGTVKGQPSWDYGAVNWTMAPHDGLYNLMETLQCIVLHEKTDIRPIGYVHTAGLKALFRFLLAVHIII